MPVPDTNGEEWDRLEPTPALDILVELVLHGEYHGLSDRRRTGEDLELRAAAASVFEVMTAYNVARLLMTMSLDFQNFVRKDSVKDAIVQAMLRQEGAGTACLVFV